MKFLISQVAYVVTDREQRANLRALLKHLAPFVTSSDAFPPPSRAKEAGERFPDEMARYDG